MSNEIRTAVELDNLAAGTVIHLPHATNVAIKDAEGTWAVAGHPDPWTSQKVHQGLHGNTATILHLG